MQTGKSHGPIWFSVGEASGDLHGAELIKRMKEVHFDTEFIGMGGPSMTEEGFKPLYDMKLISLVGITEILGGLPRILLLLRKIKKKLAEVRPRAIILVDCPEFNFQIAKMAKKLGIPVYYYISPQIWAWRSGRVHFLRKYVRRVICILPFEKQFYEKFGVEVDYVGHPLMDVLPLETLDALPVDEQRIGLLPGSRTKEISTLLPVFAETARKLSKRHPNLRYVMVCAPGRDKAQLMDQWPEDIPVECVEPDNRYETFRSCKFIMAASGTVTLETALIGTPVIVAYKLSPISYYLATKLVNVEYASLPNLILDKEIYPEQLQDDAEAGKIAVIAHTWLNDPKAYAAVKDQLGILRTMVGEPGAPKRAAEIIYNDLESIDR